jgi:hypothetical protein
MTKIDLTTFMLSIASAAYMGLGVVPGEAGKLAEVNLELAKQNIDLLELLQEKTKGNRSADEEQLLTQLLFETRMRFVETQNKLKK